MTTTFSLFVEGKPVPQGSKSVGKHGQLYEKNGAELYSWRTAIAMQARQRMQGHDVMSDPLEVYLDFYFRRANHHYTTKGALKPAAPAKHVFKPDIDKLARAVLDALTGVVFGDDRQVISLTANKHFAPRAEDSGVQILIAVPLEQDPDSEFV